MNSKDEYVRKMQAKLELWSAEIDVLGAKAEKAAAEFKLEYIEQIETLKGMQATARQKLGELQKSGESAREDLKAGIELAWSAIGEALDSARSRFK